LDFIWTNHQCSKIFAWKKCDSQRYQVRKYFNDIRVKTQTWRLGYVQDYDKIGLTHIHSCRHSNLFCPLNDSEPTLFFSGWYLGIRVRIVLFGGFRTSFSLSYDVNFGILRNRQAFKTDKWKIQCVIDKFHKLMFWKVIK